MSPADIIAWRDGLLMPVSRVPATRIRFGPPPERSWTGPPLRECAACDVTWRGGPACWCCGRAAAAN